MKNTKKTEPQLLEELVSQQETIERLRKNDAARNREQVRYRSLANELTERLKELNCLYAISKVHVSPNTPVEDVILSILNEIPPALQFPEIACVQLKLGKAKYATDNYHETRCGIFLHTTLSDGSECILSTCYFEPQLGQAPPCFLDEEVRLLNAVLDQIRSKLELHIELKRAEKHQEQLLQLDKMVALGTLVSGVAHEINNPNNFIMLNTPLLAEAWTGVLPILDEYAENNGDFLLGGLNYSEIRKNIVPLFTGIIDGARRIKGIVEGLKSFARTDSPNRVPGVDVNATVRAALLLVNNQVKRATDRLDVTFGEELPNLVANAQRLEQVWVNLIQNACEALPSTEMGISVFTSYDKQTGCVVVEVHDQGPGISDDIQQKVMDPFFTTKRDTGGTGLGLAISHGIVRSHGGTLALTSNSAGTVATVAIPVENHNASSRESR